MFGSQINREMICRYGETFLCLKLPQCFSCETWQNKVFTSLGDSILTLIKVLQHSWVLSIWQGITNKSSPWCILMHRPYCACLCVDQPGGEGNAPNTCSPPSSQNGLSASDSGRSSSGKSSSSYQRLSHMSDAPAPLRPSPSSDDIIQDLEDRLWEKEQEVRRPAGTPWSQM